MTRKKAADDEVSEEGFAKVATVRGCLIKISETDEGFWTVQLWRGAAENPEGKGAENVKLALAKSEYPDAEAALKKAGEYA